MESEGSAGVSQSTGGGGSPGDGETAQQMLAVAAAVRASSGGSFQQSIPEEKFQEAAARMLDIKSLAKPGNFSGKDSDWIEWRFKFESLCSLIDVEEAMTLAARGSGVEVQTLEVEHPMRSRLLYNLLVTTCQARALATVRAGPRYNGFEAWARLVQEYEPGLATRRMSLLSGLLAPTLSQEAFTEDLLGWERKVRQYEQLVGTTFPSDVKCAIVAQHAPKHIRAFLQLSTQEVMENYDTLRAALQLRSLRSRVFDDSGMGVEDPTPMDVGALYPGKGKGKGKGKEKGKAKGLGKSKGKGKGKAAGTSTTTSKTCFLCGRPDHYARDCPSTRRSASTQHQLQQVPATAVAPTRAKFSGRCHRCGKVGHRQADCWAKVAEITGGEVVHGMHGEEAGDVHVVQSERWIFMVAPVGVKPGRAAWQQERGVLILVDSGAFTHVCPPNFAQHCPTERPHHPTEARTADGRSLYDGGTKRVPLRLQTGQEVVVPFSVRPVTKPIISVSELEERGFATHFGAGGGYIEKVEDDGDEDAEATRVRLYPHGGLYYLPAEFVEAPEVCAVEWESNVQVMDPSASECKWLLVEYCCEPDSLLSQWFFDHQQAITRLSLPGQDVTDPAVLARVYHDIVMAVKRGLKVLVWTSLPCTAWCGWQQINMTRSEEAEQRVYAARQVSSAMLDDWLDLVLVCLEDPELKDWVSFAFEWPKGALGWSLPQFQTIRQYLPIECLCDGCCYELQDEHGMWLKKPWKIWTNLPCLLPPLSQRCDGRHPLHGVTHGESAEASGRYTTSFVEQVGSAVVESEAGGVQPVEAAADEEEVVADGTDFAGTGEREPQLAVSPALPSEAAQQAHMVTHLPYAAWCPVCVRARGVSQQHRRQPEPVGMPILEMDYTYMRAGTDPLTTIMAAVLRPTGFGAATIARHKGPEDKHVLQVLLNFLAEAGCLGELRLRTDSEVAIVALARELARVRRAQTVLEVTPVGSSNSLGGAERFCESLGGMIRTLRLSTEALWQTRITTDHSLFAWSVPHAAWLLARFQPHRSGMTSFELLHHRPFQHTIYQFAEAVLARRGEATKQPKLEMRWEPGLWLGMRGSSGEHIVGTAGGILYTQTVKPMPKELWNRELLNQMTFLPWSVSPGLIDPEGLGAATTVGASASSSSAERPVPQPVPADPLRIGVGDLHRARLKDPRLRTARIHAFWDMEGKTPGCGACNKEGPIGDTKHSAQCRARQRVWESRMQEQRQQPEAPDQPMVQVAGKRPRDPEHEQELEAEEERARAGARDDDEEPPPLVADSDDEAEPRMVDLIDVDGPPWFDEYTGEQLDDQQVAEAMAKELGSWEKFNAVQSIKDMDYPELPRVPCRWLFYKRADGQSVKARIVAQQVNYGAPMEGAYASTPVSMAPNLVLMWSLMDDDRVVFPGDVGTAFLHAELPESQRVVLVPPTPQKVAGRAWLPLRAIYGLRVSPGLFQEHFASVLGKQDYKRCIADRQLFFKEAYQVVITVHADDILFACPRQFKDLVCEEISAELLVRWGPEIGENPTKYLGKFWRKIPKGFAVRMPDRFFQKLLALYNLEYCKPIRAPNVVAATLRGDTPELTDAAAVRRYRSAVGKLLWLSHVRPDVSYLAKELARHMQKPGEAHAQAVKSVLRFLAGTQTAELHITRDSQAAPNSVNVWVDASWGSDFGRKSTAGGRIVAAGVGLSHWSRTLAVITMSSCESELLAMCLGAQEGFLVVSLMEELGLKPEMTLHSDSQAAIDWLGKKGMGRLKHIELRQMWIQEAVRSGRMKVQFERGSDNVADLLTKVMPGLRMRNLAKKFGICYEEPLISMVEGAEAAAEPSSADMWSEFLQAHFWTVSAMMLAGAVQYTSWLWRATSAVVQCCRRPSRVSSAEPVPEAGSPSGSTAARSPSVSATPRRAQRAKTPFQAGRQTPYTCACGYRLDARVVVSSGANEGRLYVACPLPRGDAKRCDYFRWL